MTSQAITNLLYLAAVTGVVHTILGPDHYVPFVAMSRVGRWSYARTIIVSVLCGIGHVLGSILLGVIGIAGGIAVSGLEFVEAARGNIAAWLLLGFGIAYTVWGVRRAIRSRSNDHRIDQCATPRDAARSMTAWMLFSIFLFGPCEPLIPQLMVPAATHNWLALVLVVVTFTAATIAAMTIAVTVGYFGLGRVSLRAVERYSHAVAGLALVACGAANHLGL